jgi:hypothetical protein
LRLWFYFLKKIPKYISRRHEESGIAVEQANCVILRVVINNLCSAEDFSKHCDRLTIRYSGPGDRRDLQAKLYDGDGGGGKRRYRPPAAACPGGQARELIAVRRIRNGYTRSSLGCKDSFEQDQE